MKIGLLLLALFKLTSCAPTTEPETALSGLTYSGFKEQGCKDRAEIETDMVKVGRYTSRLRLYGNECNQVNYVLEAISKRKLHLRILIGLWTRDNNLDQETNKILQILDRPQYRGLIMGVTVGNEEVFNGVPPGQVVANINRVKDKLRGKGIRIPVSTAEVGHLWSQEMASASDVIYTNLYSFFSQGSGNIKDAAKSIVIQADELKAKFNKKSVVVSETGWPSGGNFAGPHFAAPSPTNQKSFVEALSCYTKPNYQFFVMEAFDNPSKGSPGSIERSFGTLDKNGNLKWGSFSAIRC